jgi:hypothetical protein
MKYDHTVKYKGIYYSAGIEVPVEVEKTPEEIEIEKAEAEKLAQIKAVKAMKREELDAYAPTIGITVEENDTVITLKEKIIAELNK